jgi:Domain of unknown function (DUF4157)
VPVSRDHRESIDGPTPSDATTSNNGRTSATRTTSGNSRTSTVAPSDATAPAATRGAPAVPPAPTGPARSATVPTDTGPAERLADQFMTELSQTVRRTPAPLPMPFRPMSDAITGGRRVMLSTDPASRRALRSVGKIAATTGDTIHLDHAAIPRRRLDEVVAHELTHVAHPSPTPRFFDDIDDSPEERRAEKVASIMARSPLAPSSTVAAPRSGAIRRSPAHAGGGGASSSASSSSSSGTISADALAARLTGSSPAAASRSGSSRSGSDPSRDSAAAVSRSVTRAPAVIRRSPANVSAAPVSAAPEQRHAIRRVFADGPESGSGSVDDLNKLVDERIAANVDSLLRMIEDRMIVELERRGGRSWRSS